MGKSNVAGLGGGGLHYFVKRVTMPMNDTPDFAVPGFPADAKGFVAILVPAVGYGTQSTMKDGGTVYVCLPEAGIAAKGCGWKDSPYTCCSMKQSGMTSYDMRLIEGVLHCFVQTYNAIAIGSTYEVIVWY